MTNIGVTPPSPRCAGADKEAPLVTSHHVRVVVLVQKVATVVPVQFDPAGLQGEYLFVAVFSTAGALVVVTV